MQIFRKLLAVCATTIVCACTDSTGPMGPAGTQGPAGAPGKDAVVDYDQIKAYIPPIVREEIAKNPPQVTLDTAKLVETIVSKMPVVTGPAGPQGPQGEKGDKGDPGAPGGLAFNADGDIIMPQNARLCWIQCFADAGEQIQILGNGAGILRVANWDRSWYQSSDLQWAVDGLSPDGGWRISQNQRWTKNGQHLSWINNKPQSTVGFDSQGMWSMQTRPVGDTGGGQDLVFNINRPNGTLDLTAWQSGVKLRLCQTPAGAPYSDATDCR